MGLTTSLGGKGDRHRLCKAPFGPLRGKRSQSPLPRKLAAPGGIAPFGFTTTPPSSYNPAMTDSAPEEVPPIFPRFLAGGPEPLRLGPASAALLVAVGALVHFLNGGCPIRDGWPVLSGSATATIVAALLTAMLAARWLGKLLGLAAGLLQLTCLYAVGLPGEPRLVQSWLTLLVMAAMGIFARANVPGRLPEDTRRRMPVFFYSCATMLLLVCRGWGEFAGVLLACVSYLF